jgi:hypothetical protein
VFAVIFLGAGVYATDGPDPNIAIATITLAISSLAINITILLHADALLHGEVLVPDMRTSHYLGAH